MDEESFRVSGIEVTLAPNGEVRSRGQLLGRVAREARHGQFYWRAFDPGSDQPVKRFLTARHEAIQVLLLRADLIGGIGF